MRKPAWRMFRILAIGCVALSGPGVSAEDVRTFDVKPKATGRGADPTPDWAPDERSFYHGLTDILPGPAGPRAKPPTPPKFAADRQGCDDALAPRAALDICSRVIAAGRADALTYKVRGNARYHLDDLPGALADFQAAIRLAPDWESPYFNEAVTYYNLKDYDRSLWDLKTVLYLNPGKAKAHRLKGNILYVSEMYFQAIRAYERALEVDPGDTNSRDWLEKARANWDRVSAAEYVDENDEADSLIESGRIDEAMDSLSRSIAAMRAADQVPAVNGALAEQMLIRAAIRFAKADEAGAAADLLDAAREMMRIAFQNDEMYVFHPDFIAAAAYELTGADPDNAPMLANLAFALDWDNRSDESISVSTRVLALARNDFERVEALTGRHHAFRKAGRNNEALGDLDAAIALIPSAPLFALRSEVNVRLMDYPAAVADLTSAMLASAPGGEQQAGFLLRRAKLLREAWQFDKAMRDLNKLAAMAPGQAGLFGERILLLAAMGRLKQARAKLAELERNAPNRFNLLRRDLEDFPDLQYDSNSRKWDVVGAVVTCRVDDATDLAISDQQVVDACTFLIANGGVTRSDGSQDPAGTAQLYFRRAWTLGPMGKLDRARRDMTAAIWLDPGVAGYYATRARLSEALGDTVRAGQDRKKACVMDRQFCD